MGYGRSNSRGLAPKQEASWNPSASCRESHHGPPSTSYLDSCGHRLRLVPGCAGGRSNGRRSLEIRKRHPHHILSRKEGHGRIRFKVCQAITYQAGNPICGLHLRGVWVQTAGVLTSVAGVSAVGSPLPFTTPNAVEEVRPPLRRKITLMTSAFAPRAIGAFSISLHI